MKKVVSILLAMVMLIGITGVLSSCDKFNVKKAVTVDSVEDLQNLQIGVQAGSYALDALQAHEAYETYKDNIKEYEDYDQAILALNAGTVDVIVVDEVLGEYKNSKLPDEQKMVVCDFNFGDDFYAIGCRKGETAVSSKINEALKTLIDNGKAAEISNKWFGKDIVIFENYGTDAVVEDTAAWDYIAEKGTLIVGLDDSFPPMGFRDEDNNIVGFDIDLAIAVGEILGVNVAFQPIDWNSKEVELSSKKIDCIWNGMSATEKRQEEMSLTNKYLNNKMVIMTSAK